MISYHGPKLERVHARVHSFTPKCSLFRPLGAHGAHAVASLKKLPSGNWRVQVRRKDRYVAETFRRRKDAEEWALDIERRIDRGETPALRVRLDPTTFRHLKDLHLADMREVGRCPRRSKAYSLDALGAKLGKTKIVDLDSGTTDPVWQGSKQGRRRAGHRRNGPVLYWNVIAHVAAVHGIAVSPETVDLARSALKRLGLVGRGRARDRRPTDDELKRPLVYCDEEPRQTIPVGRIVRFAIATAMRQDEICRIRWRDVDADTRTVVVRDRKDPLPAIPPTRIPR